MSNFEPWLVFPAATYNKLERAGEIVDGYLADTDRITPNVRVLKQGDPDDFKVEVGFRMRRVQREANEDLRWRLAPLAERMEPAI